MRCMRLWMQRIDIRRSFTRIEGGFGLVVMVMGMEESGA